ncbi:flagellar hook assembly protein FlgD [Rhodoferax sp. 4810]|uniref:Basal-body rod modification protein FlgD n=1 Tax=Thiospirillum jenense TaxID=1653858 RepID=A0A839HCF8_9GAMM|nr:flagellar hook assembly protein FlgD [Thiospirillum jenense]MBB1073954.1 flagellar hook assembly protein FlgD [Rhodoferax jenense]MBB1125830.1 flagellar hook assembly protein FlgD [Thiospirillum jenense]
MSQFSASTLEGLGLYRPEVNQVNNSQNLGQSDFLKLMTVQLSNQDPFAPMENTDFIAQMAQFSSLTGIESLSKSFDSLAQTLSQNQTLQAASLVGSQVLVPMDSQPLVEGQTISGAVELPATATGVNVDVTDSTGQLIDRIELGNLPAGLNDFSWDGLRSDNTPAPPGDYQFTVTAQDSGSTAPIKLCLNARVDSVAVSTDGNLQLSIAGAGVINLADVRRVS